MRVNSINSAFPMQKNMGTKKVGLNVAAARTAGRFNVVSMSEYLNSQVSFKGRNQEQAIFYGAEVAPYSKAGGVGVVMKDYGFLLEPKNEVVVSPYYRANVNKETGEVTPKKNENGDYILETNEGVKVLDLVAQKNMQWGAREENKIMLFSLREESDKVHYFVFDDATAHFPKPYAGGFVYASGAKAHTNAWNGDPYAKNSKAFVELLPELIASKKGFNPATIVCSDSQTAYTHEYMVQKATTDKDYDEIKTTHVGHNLGPGYCGETSMQNMFVNLGATPAQIELIENDPIYKQGILGDNYFKPFVEETLDETGTASATQIAIKHAQNGFVKSFSVVAEDYADALATNPQAAYNIHNSVKGLYESGVFNGILNPLEDTSIDATKKLPNALYNEDCKDIDGKIYEAFELYPQNVSFEEMTAIKNRNKARLLERLSAKDPSILTGAKGRKANINPEATGVYDGPVIRQDLIDKIKAGKGNEVPLFISWGRIDTQKGHDISLSAFEKFAKTPEGKDAIFILGAGLDDTNEESKRVSKKVKEMLADPELQGRIVHIDGWAPAYAMSSAADAAVFTSRFEPCGLTDIEAMKYYCMPIVANTQGFKQKNFDPRNSNEVHKATSFKTQHEFDLLKSQVEPIIEAYVNKSEVAKEQVKQEYPIFWKEENGQKVYDDSVFVKFAQEYSEYISAKEAELKANSQDGTLPEGWNDWDNLSKNYAFKFTGFARDLKDAILIAETAEAIKACSQTDAQTKASMFENLKALKTGWKENQVLHPTNQSSYDLYRERHLLSDYSKPDKDSVIAKDTRFIINQIESRQKTDIGHRVGAYMLGALTGLGAILFNRTKNSEYKSVEEQLTRQIEELQRQLKNKDSEIVEKVAQVTKSLNKKLLITGGVSAAAAAGITFLATKAYLNKKNKKQINTQTPTAPSGQAVSATPATLVEKKEPIPTISTPIKTNTAKITEKQSGIFADFNKFA